jgi:hypothetical protein
MSKITIYKYGTTQVRAIVEPNDNSVQQVGLMRQDILVLNFDSAINISFQIGDYCTFLKQLYQINKKPSRTKVAERNINYVLTLEAEMYDLGKVDFFALDADNNFSEAIFSFRGKLQNFGDLIIHNLKRVFPTANWILGEVEQTDFVTLDFNSQNCLQAIQTIAQAFNTEYLIEGKTINLFQRQSSSGLILRQGTYNPLVSLTEADQDQSNVITRLYPLGSTRNITNTYRGGSKNLRIGDVPYLEKNVDKYRIVEYTKIFDGSDGTPEIYPHRTGTVSAVDDPFNFYDSAIDFNVNDYLISGVVAQLVFNTGLLSGYTFNISAFNNSTKKFTILVNSDEKSITVPSVEFTPAVGDKYVLINIKMPQSYIDQAETDLLAAAEAFLDQYSEPPVAYSGNCNANWFRDNNRTFKLAEKAQISDDDLEISVVKRITAYTRKVNDIFDMTLELSDTVPPKSIIVTLLNGL